MPNPRGTNQLPGGKKDLPYGGVQQAQQLTKAAPMSGAPTSALNAPQRNQRAAVRGRRTAPQRQRQAQQQQDPDLVPMLAPQGPDAAAFWQDAALDPNASELVRHYAQRAMTQKAHAKVHSGH